MEDGQASCGLGTDKNPRSTWRDGSLKRFQQDGTIARLICWDMEAEPGQARSRWGGGMTTRIIYVGVYPYMSFDQRELGR